MLWPCLRPALRSSLLFIDVRMPGMSGPELAERCDGGVPISGFVLTSGYVGEEDVPKGLPLCPSPGAWTKSPELSACGQQLSPVSV
jgi:CheY-like chemotaxis protein